MRFGRVILALLVCAAFAGSASSAAAQEDPLHVLLRVSRLMAAEKHKDAIRLAESSIRRQEKRRTTDTLVFAETLHTLGDLYARTERFVDAERQYQRSLKVAENAEGIRKQSILVRISKTQGEFYDKQKRYGEAATAYQRALTIIDAPRDDNNDNNDSPVRGTDPDRLVCGLLLKLAGDMQGLDRWAEAEPLLKRCIAINESIRGAYYKELSLPMISLQATYEKLGRTAEAKAIESRLAALREMFRVRSSPY